MISLLRGRVALECVDAATSTEYCNGFVIDPESALFGQRLVLVKAFDEKKSLKKFECQVSLRPGLPTALRLKSALLGVPSIDVIKIATWGDIHDLEVEAVDCCDNACSIDTLYELGLSLRVVPDDDDTRTIFSSKFCSNPIKVSFSNSLLWKSFNTCDDITYCFKGEYNHRDELISLPVTNLDLQVEFSEIVSEIKVTFKVDGIEVNEDPAPTEGMSKQSMLLTFLQENHETYVSLDQHFTISVEFTCSDNNTRSVRVEDLFDKPKIISKAEGSLKLNCYEIPFAVSYEKGIYKIIVTHSEKRACFATLPSSLLTVSDLMCMKLLFL